MRRGPNFQKSFIRKARTSRSHRSGVSTLWEIGSGIFLFSTEGDVVQFFQFVYLSEISSALTFQLLLEVARCACLPRPRSGPGPVGRECGASIQTKSIRSNLIPLT